MISEFENIKVEIEQRSNVAKSNAQKMQTHTEKSSVADKLEKLSELLDAGILSQEKFDSQKMKLLV